jgi:hypothetical protein
MAIRLPLQTVASFDDSNDTGTGSVSGGIPHVFTIPQDTDNVVVKMTGSVSGTGVSATFQTSDDGGTTWYDVARTSIVSNANSTTAEWLNIPISGQGFRSAVQAQTSVAGSTNVAVALNTVGAAAASSLSHSQNSGLPIMGQAGRIFIIINGDVTSAASNSLVTKVMANSQSATA